MKRKVSYFALALLMGLTCMLAACGPEEEEEVKYTLKLEGTRYELACDIDEATTATVRVKATANGEAIENPSVTYTVGDPAVAEVNAQGVITAKQKGHTTVTAKFMDVERSAPVTVYAKATSEQVNGFGAEYINLFGRNYASGEGMRFDHVGSAVEVAFYGESLSANVELLRTTDPAATVYARIFVDDDTDGTFKKLETKEDFTFVSGLNKGLHTVRVVKSSEFTDGAMILKDFDAEQFLTAPYKSDYKIEFIGDSITAGYGTLAKGGTRSAENSDVTKGYAYLTAQTLGVDYSIVAKSGICVKTFMWGGTDNMLQMYPLLTPLGTELYDFSDDVDMVVLNLGTNDNSYISYSASPHPEYAGQFPTDYKEFLTLIREKRPNAKIVCVYGNMGKYAPIDNGIKKALEEMKDPKISYYVFQPSASGANGHPSEANNKALVPNFVKYLQGIM